jgi:hypothetical protein
MNARFSKFLLVTVMGVSLAACAQINRETATAAAPADDDAYCRTGGAPGSDGYAVCMKNRDVAREQSQVRRDRTHKRVAEDMLNGR